MRYRYAHSCALALISMLASVQVQADGSTLKAPPQSASQKAILQQNTDFFYPTMTLQSSMSYAYSDQNTLNLNGFLALGAIFLGNINVSKVKSSIYTFTESAYYPLSDRLQLVMNVPIVYRQSTYEIGGAGYASSAQSQASVTSGGPRLGDVSFGGYYQIFKESKNWPSLTGSLLVTAPTGINPYGIKVIQPDPNNTNLSVPTNLPTGNGVWTLTPGLSFVSTSDPAIFFGSVNYYYNLDKNFSDISTTPGSVQPGEVALGNAFQYSLGVAFALNERLSLSTSFADRIQDDTLIRAPGGPWTTIVGSGANVAVANVGMTYAFNPNTSLIVNLGVGITSSAPSFQLTATIPYNL
ncbi:MAG: transporter [Planctomycetia bacterium]|nr:transporter [Planctomycetia bacterium]